MLRGLGVEGFRGLGFRVQLVVKGLGRFRVYVQCLGL